MIRHRREAEDFLTGLIREGIKYGLEHFHRFLAELDHPEERNPWVHVAGTNGKGSVAAMVEAILRAQGEPTVLFTSPHLVSLRERFRVDGRQASDEAFVRAAARLEEGSRRLVEAGHEVPTFFEACAALSFELAAAHGESWGVAEVGLGGRLDATNVLYPECAVITSVDLDHTKTLGETREKIAIEKAHIAKEGVPLVVGEVAPGPRAEIERVGRERGAEVEFLAGAVELLGVDRERRLTRFHLRTPVREYRDLSVRLLGTHQARNAGLAVRAVERALERHGKVLDEDAVRRGLARVRWPGRFDVRPGDPLVVLDAVHNAEGMGSFAATWEACFGDRPAAVLFGACSDKNLRDVFGPLSRIARSVTFSKAGIRRAAEPEDLRVRWEELGHGAVPATAEPDLAAAWEHAREQALHQGIPLVVCGSLYLLGDLLALPGTPEVDPPGDD